jgi:osmoprotectant transport system ATP-binding protein
MFHLEGVAKSFAGTVALHPTDLSLEPGRTTVLIGPSGCGKSTLLRLMIGLMQPDEGTIFFDGDPVTPKNVMHLRRRIGYVIQDGGLFPHLTCGQNVTLMARFLRRDRREIASRVAELSQLVHLPDGALDRYPGQISGGQRQRVGIMRALMLEPEVLFLDEPMGSLDPLIRYDLQEDLRAIFRTLNKTVVLVTHDLAEAGFFGDDIVLMNAGKIVQRGTLPDMAERPADPFVTRFLNAQRLPDFSGVEEKEATWTAE